jgi:hypothetical protein
MEQIHRFLPLSGGMPDAMQGMLENGQLVNPIAQIV